MMLEEGNGVADGVPKALQFRVHRWSSGRAVVMRPMPRVERVGRCVSRNSHAVAPGPTAVVPIVSREGATRQGVAPDQILVGAACHRRNSASLVVRERRMIGSFGRQRVGGHWLRVGQAVRGVGAITRAVAEVMLSVHFDAAVIAR